MKITKTRDALVFYDEISAGWEHWLLLMSDEHFDNPSCDRQLLKRHHEEAMERNATILKFGDVFCAMGGKYDPRGNSKGEIRKEYQSSRDYFDEITRDAIRFYSPYASNIAMISDGNHEASVRSRQEIDLIERLKEGLGNHIIHGSYAGFIRFAFEFKAVSKGRMTSRVMYYTHGSGGYAPVTKGVIQSARRQDAVLADFYVSGHIHNEYAVPRPQIYLSNGNIIKRKETQHWQLGTYKHSAQELMDGWVPQKGFSPPAVGGRWVRFFYKNRELKVQSFATD